MVVLGKKIKVTLDTGCINKNPHIHLDQIFDLKENGKIDVYVPDGVIKNILNNEFKLSDINSLNSSSPKEIAVKRRLRKIENCSTIIKGNLRCGDDVYGRVGGTSGGENISVYENKIKEIINSSNYDYEDIRILMLHISAKNDVFITTDKKHFINNGRREKFLRELKVYIREADEFVRDFNLDISLGIFPIARYTA